MSNKTNYPNYAAYAQQEYRRSWLKTFLVIAGACLMLAGIIVISITLALGARDDAKKDEKGRALLEQMRKQSVERGY